MGLMQRAVETYDNNSSLVGEYVDGHAPLVPICHTVTTADIEITINKSGKLIDIQKRNKKEPKVIIPVTEASESRTGTKTNETPHPLCDQIEYFLAEENYFLKGLAKWEASKYTHPFLSAIKAYLEHESIKEDIETYLGEIKKKSFIVWRVVGIEDETPECWKNKKLHKAFIDYYMDQISERTPKLCMITGTLDIPAQQHPKGILPVSGNAKLISDNDKKNFTYLGRFTDSSEAVTIGYISSRKAHNALRWLMSEQGVREFCGKRVYICWEPKGKQLPRPFRGLRSFDAEPTYVPSDYKDALESLIKGYRTENAAKISDTAILAAFEAATNGRLSIVYYNELSTDLFLQRMKDWDSKCFWIYGKFGIQAPSLYDIVNCAFGTQRDGKIETDDKIARVQLQRLLDCKVNGGIFPEYILRSLCMKASSPQSYNMNNWRKVVRTACAAMQKYFYDTKKGGNEMPWELTKKDRSFQFGRLLAVLERAEEDYYHKTKETRKTNAIKNLSDFRRTPWSVYERLNRFLNQAYLPRIELWQANRYKRLTGEICSLLMDYDEAELDKALENTYLMGYELQRNAFFAKNNEKNMEEK